MRGAMDAASPSARNARDREGANERQRAHIKPRGRCAIIAESRVIEVDVFLRLELSSIGQVVSSIGRETAQMSDHFGHASSRVSAAPLLTIDPSSREPLQQQIYRGLRRAILDGVLTPGTRLISSRALATELAVSRTTTLLAFDQLLAEGYVSARHGSGTFVARELPDDLPRVARVHSPSRGKLPSLSRQGMALASLPRVARRLGPSPRPFRRGVPAGVP